MQILHHQRAIFFLFYGLVHLSWISRGSSWNREIPSFPSLFFKFHKEYSHQGKCPMSLIRFDVLGMLQISQKSVFLFAWILVRFMSEWDMLFVRCFLVGSDLQLLLRGIIKNLKWGVQTLYLNYGALTFDSHKKLRINLWNIVVFLRFS